VAYLRHEEKRLQQLRTRAVHTAFAAGFSAPRPSPLAPPPRVAALPPYYPPQLPVYQAPAAPGGNVGTAGTAGTAGTVADVAVVMTETEASAPVLLPTRLLHSSLRPRHPGRQDTILGPASSTLTPCRCLGHPSLASWGLDQPPIRRSMRHRSTTLLRATPRPPTTAHHLRRRSTPRCCTPSTPPPTLAPMAAVVIGSWTPAPLLI
jgi:hypothetical protein